MMVACCGAVYYCASVVISLLYSAEAFPNFIMLRTSPSRILTWTKFFNSKAGSITTKAEPSTQYMEVATRLWVERFVMGQGMCPWAGTVLVGEKLRIRTMYGDGDDDQKVVQLCEDIIFEAKILYDNEDKSLGETSTTLIVLPDLKDFNKFLELVDIVEGLFEQENIDEYLQVAHFHPQYIFADSTEPENEIENYTNRSPFPLIHLLKVEEVSAAIESYGDTSIIWKNNKKVLRKMGLAKVKALAAKILVDTEVEISCFKIGDIKNTEFIQISE